MNPNTLLADPAAIAIDKFVSLDDSIFIVAHSIQASAACPSCGTDSNSLKGHYLRRLADLPWHNVTIRLELKVRKFRCRHRVCAKKVFGERLPSVAAVYARRTKRLTDALTLLAFALGGRGAARVAEQMNLSPVGKDTLLKLLRHSAEKFNQADTPPVKVLGVDDFAFRKGINYGTILVDLERREPIELLADRTSETLAAWLRAHPGIEIVSRDRSAVYAEAIRVGAPSAAQVADRWHLLENLGDLVERFFVQNHHLLTRAAENVRALHLKAENQLPCAVRENDSANNPKPIPPRRQQLFDSIKQLQMSDQSLRGIARQLKISRNTVRRYVKCETVPQHCSGAGRKSSVMPFTSYLEQRWCEGEHNGERLCREIRERGFSGDAEAVQRFVKKWRNSRVGKISCPIAGRGLAPRQTAKLLLNPAAIKNDSERLYLKGLQEISPQVVAVERLGTGFQQIVKEKRGDLFDEWLLAVKQSGIAEFEKWANGLLADEAAVRNALSSEWSNGQTEGQVNRLKTIKRQLYGRAGFDLLRARVLHRA